MKVKIKYVQNKIIHKDCGGVLYQLSYAKGIGLHKVKRISIKARCCDKCHEIIAMD